MSHEHPVLIIVLFCFLVLLICLLWPPDPASYFEALASLELAVLQTGFNVLVILCLSLPENKGMYLYGWYYFINICWGVVHRVHPDPKEPLLDGQISQHVVFFCENVAGLWMFVSPLKFIRGNPNPQSDGVRRCSLWERIGPWRRYSWMGFMTSWRSLRNPTHLSQHIKALVYTQEETFHQPLNMFPDLWLPRPSGMRNLFPLSMDQLSITWFCYSKQTAFLVLLGFRNLNM